MKKNEKRKSILGYSLKIPKNILPVERHKERIEKLFGQFELCEAYDLANSILTDYNNSDEKNSFSDWFNEELRKAEGKLRHEIRVMFKGGQEDIAEKLYRKNTPHIKKHIIVKYRNQARDRREYSIIVSLLKSFDFKQAESRWVLAGRVSEHEYNHIRFDCLTKFLREKLVPLLERSRFKKANQLWCDAGKPLADQYNKFKKESYLNSFRELLEQFRFKESDTKWNNSEALYSADYRLIKTEYIKRYFEDEFELTLDDEQAAALADMSDSLLVTARAGAGKTRTLTAKAVLLASKYNIDPNHILLLAFNTNAAKEIKSRISEICHDMDFNNIRTFHSLSCGILDRPDIEQNPERFVDRAIKDLLSGDGDFKKRIYQYFKNDIAKIENGLTDEEYNSIREKGVSVIDCNRVYISIDGRHVKSRGEKWIADFLFEHNLNHEGQKIWYAYEKPHRNITGNGVEIIKPDFTIGWEQRYSFLLEHWAIDDKVGFPDSQIWRGSKMTYKRYDEIRKCKRMRFGGELLETYPRDMKDGRVGFENKLKGLFGQRNIQCIKKEDKTLHDEAFDQANNRIRNLFLMFIQRCAQKEWTVEIVKKKLESHSGSEIEKVFLSAATEVYCKYYEQFRATPDGDLTRYDFSMLLPEATKKIKDGCLLKLKFYDGEKVGNNENRIKVQDIKYILVDEYQDFSQLFYNFIKVIKEHSGAKLFCVGDDWQAINGFAGSDLRFFAEYEEYYNQTNRCNIVTNYRSCTSVVENGNLLMDGLGEEARAWNTEKGAVKKVFIDDYFVDFSENNENQEDMAYICRYSKNNAIDTKASMLLKVVHNILSESENVEILRSNLETSGDAKCMILTRKKRLHSFGSPPEKNSRSGDKFTEKIIGCLIEKGQFDKEETKDLREKIARKTVHKAKGEEAEIVIVLNCCSRSFPMLHPDNKLFHVFGVTDETIYDEERRLFYVALTRAKQKVYLITQKDCESVFLKGLSTHDISIDVSF